MNWLFLTGVTVTGLVLFTIIGFLCYSWYIKRQQHKQLEHLLDEIRERQNSRKNKLSRKLGRHFKLSESDAQGISSQLIGAEKLFLKHYIDQLLQQKPNDIVYDQLCELLDYYLNKLTSQPRATDSSTSPDGANTIDAKENAKDSTTGENTIPEPDWGDVFD
ncbi:hypothetical protein NP590_03145 [Methylomonas sp. SURF-2]|uniref:DUF1043 domain-containing protein n=1 Tax=Methylomonas subterranea TaxID=2952225 RepID=A0ABT1TCA9_9GAMM|nr:hypothetical protein [Methylomonas sp. SURF-2]MCQ8103093.1 hypothetical protein [Methylomonas sp. SURF-2]